MSAEPKSENITWHGSRVSREDRKTVLGHRSVLVWLTGLSGSGKSTVARALEEALVKRGDQAYVLDGDNIRFGLNKDLGFSPEDRTENIRRVGHVAKLFVDSGTIVITAFISPYRRDRDAARAIQVEHSDFVEVYLDCPIEVCESRDPKGLYKKARRGEISEFTGVSAPYEAPLDPDLVLNTGTQTLAESVEAVIQHLVARGTLVS